MTDAFDLAQTLETHGQSHLLAGIDDLPEAERSAYMARLAEVDWAELAEHSEPPPMSAVGPARVIDMAERATRYDEFIAAGEKAYSDGAVAVLMVAGGMGSRLGFSGPKGCFEAGAHSGKSIYQLQAEKVLAASRRSGKKVPFLVMTSPVTDKETRDFFAINDNFGLEDDQVRYFSQGTVPSLDSDGKALMKSPGQMLENPDGHGGCFTALVGSGQLQRLRDEGIRQLVYIQVDNILVPVDDPILVGMAEIENTDVVTKVLEKAHPDEKVGHLVRQGEHDVIIEYTEVTPEQARMVGDDGQLIYRWGSPAMHCWSIAFLAGLADTGFKPPLHRSSKPLKAWTPEGDKDIQGWKCERFIFDLIPQAKVSVGLAIDRDDEFAPIKNKEGSDSVFSARQLMSDSQQKWLEAAGVSVNLGEGQLIEISAKVAGTKAQFVKEWDNRVNAVSGNYYLEE